MKCEKSGNHTISYQSLLLSTTVLNDISTTVLNDISDIFKSYINVFYKKNTL